MSQNLKFNKSLLAVVVSSALLTACGGDDTTVEPAEPAAVNVTAPAASPVDVEVINEANDAVMANVSGSVVHGKSRSVVSNLDVDLHINGETFSTSTDENGIYTFAELATNSDYFLVVSDTTSAMSPAYYQGTTGQAGQILKSISVFNALTSTITLDDVSAGNLGSSTLYISGEQFASTGLAAKGYQVNVPDNVATESNGVYTFTLPDDGNSYAVSTSSMGDYGIVDGQLNELSAGDNNVEYVMSASAAAAAEFTFNFNLTDADGMAVFAGETIEIMVAGMYYTATATSQGSYTATVGVEALNSSSVVITTTGATLPVSMEELIANPTATYNVTVSDSAIEQLEDEGTIAEFSADVISSRLVENDQYQVVIKFTHPTELITDVVDNYNDLSHTSAMWDLSQKFTVGHYNSGSYTYRGQGWVAGDYAAENVLDEHSYELPIANNGKSASDNEMNANNRHAGNWPSNYHGTKSPQEESGSRGRGSYYVTNPIYAGVAFVNSDLKVSTRASSRIPYAFEHPDYDELDETSPKYDFETEDKWTWHPEHHSVKFVIEANVDGEMAVADKISYYKAGEDTPTTIEQDVVTDQGRISGYYDVIVEEMQSALQYSWNADNTVLTIIGDVASVKADVAHNISATALSLHDNSNVQIEETFVGDLKASYSLEDISFDDGDYADNSTVTGYILEEASQYGAPSNGTLYAAETTNIGSEQYVMLPGLKYGNIGSTANYDAKFYVGGFSARKTMAGFTTFALGYNKSQKIFMGAISLNSPVELDGYMKITSVNMMYAPQGVVDPDCEVSCGAIPQFATPIFEDVAVNGLTIQFGDTEIFNGQSITPTKTVMTERSNSFYISEQGKADIESVYGEGVMLSAGMDTSLVGQPVYTYKLPTYADDGSNWAEPDGHNSSVLKSITGTINVTIDGVVYKETKTINVR